MSNIQIGEQNLQTWESKNHNNQLYRSNSLGRNPIKVVVEMTGDDGQIHQKIITQHRQSFGTSANINKMKNNIVIRNKQKKNQLPASVKFIQTARPTIGRSFVFNRFSYDNCQPLPIPKTRLSRSNSQLKKSSGNKNIEIIFCEKKLPDFVQKTNEKIQDLYRQQQVREQTVYKSTLKTSLAISKESHSISLKPSSKTNLATCLKEYGVLQKISLFIESQERRRQKCLCYELQKQPGRTLLLDVITHRFTFLKKMNKKSRNNLYQCLLRREINSLTKINIQQYMKIWELFIGRDANSSQIATFMYLFLFGKSIPTLEIAKSRLQQLNGQLNKMKIILSELLPLLTLSNSQEILLHLSKHEKLLKLFVDYIIE